MTEAPPNTVDSTLRCPRCQYNLTGLLEQRCPECGQAFDPAQLAAGFARENTPTRLDRCDPWQPHLVLIASLLELLHNTMRPRRILRRISLDGPLWSGVLMTAGGLLWIWLIAAAISGAAIFIHAGVSPGAAARAGGIWFAPRLLGALAISSALCGLALALSPHLPIGASWRQRGRVLAYASSAILFLSTVLPLLVMMLAPDAALGSRGLARMIPLLMAIACFMTFSPGREFQRGEARRVAGLFWLVPAALSGVWPVWPLIPGALDPPLWVYFVG